MPVDDRTRAQAQLILNGHPGAAAHPAPDQWDDIDDFDYFYREYAILARAQDAEEVAAALRQILDQAGYGDVPEGEAREIQRETVSRGLVRLTVPATPTLVPDLIGRLDEVLGRGVARPEHKVYVCPNACPATEPIEVPGSAAPVPPPGLDGGGRRRIPWTGNDGGGVNVSIVDTGLIPNAAADHPWLAGVRGTEENPYAADANGDMVIAPYAGHGTFVAGVLRCMAPKASVFVERAFNIAGADYETNLASSLEDALDRNPDILVFTFTSATHRDQSLHTFDDLYERRIRQMKGLVVLAPAGQQRVVTPDVAGRPPWRDRHRGPGRELAGSGEVHQLRPVGRRLRAGRRPHQRLPGGNIRVQRASHWGTPTVPRDGQLERDIVQHSGGRRADRRPDVPDWGERAAGRGFTAAICRQPGDPRSRRGALPGPGLL